MLELDKYTHTLDEHRMDKNGLYDYICSILSDEAIQKLNSFKDPAINKEIILSALKSGRLLPWPLVEAFADRLKTIHPADEPAEEGIQKFKRHKKQVHYWERKRTIVVLLIVLALCLGIFFTAKN